MVEILKQRLASGDLRVPAETQLEILQMDVLDYTPNFTDYSIVANIPYYITSPIIYKFLYETENTPKQMRLLMQEEVADKICEADKKHSYLSLSIAYRSYKTQKLFKVKKEFFTPSPKIESALLAIEPKTQSEGNAETFLRLLSA